LAQQLVRFSQRAGINPVGHGEIFLDKAVRSRKSLRISSALTSSGRRLGSRLSYSDSSKASGTHSSATDTSRATIAAVSCRCALSGAERTT
jgi:hypothetical protein